MAETLIQSDRVFLDTAFAIALASTTDHFHGLALALTGELQARSTSLVTTWAVLLEIGNALSKLQYRHAVLQLLSSLQNDPNVEIVPLTNQLLEQAMKLFAGRPAKNGA
jgi:uncharacterized protein